MLISWGLLGIFLNFNFIPLNFFNTILTGICIGEGIIILSSELGSRRKKAVE